jgi:hypothetical protein
MRKSRLILLISVLIVIAVSIIGYVSFLYWKGGASNYEPPKQAAVSPQEKVQSDLQNLSKAVDAYFIKNMEYPKKLESLQPEFLDQVAIEPLSGKPYLYTLSETGGASRYRIGVPDPKLYNAKELYIEDGKLVKN